MFAYEVTTVFTDLLMKPGARVGVTCAGLGSDTGSTIEPSSDAIDGC